MRHWFEMIYGVTDVLRDAVLNGDSLPGDLNRFFKHAQGTDLESLANGDRWILARSWFDVDKYVRQAPYFGDRQSWSEDASNSVYQWLDDFWAQYYRPSDNAGYGLRPGLATWYDDGMQLGTRYTKGGSGDVQTLAFPPKYPYDYQKFKTWMPDLVLLPDPDGDPVVRDVVWDCQTYRFRNVGQCLKSLGRDFNARRRWYQATNNDKLDAEAWGVEPAFRAARR